jgi:hypothetical protein
MRLLSPQHYSQQIHDHRGTYSTNFGNQVVFVFHKKKFQVTIPLIPSSNIGILRSAPGHQVFSCFAEDAKPPKEPAPAIFASLSALMMKPMIWSSRRRLNPSLPSRIPTMSF